MFTAWMQTKEVTKRKNFLKNGKKWEEISDSHYETIKALRIGRDSIADNWIREKYQESDKTISEEAFIKEQEGRCVAALAEKSEHFRRRAFRI
ncbi:hypothetical protein [Candidatus Cardinium hertigii]|uniref:Uncharacterized protein n=1 Tax=Candidatus Cardinium hertigii TaxID=247481 RepID=A0A2Z3L7S6_9BACT|nr:hypothetical protein [Candidatus Cardinium hertigii]AWN81511.1 hypothetical protein DK880_00177 [Candidatus Cardinium hertigii]